MNILLLGNGFDLHYYLPTKYNNFLHTVEYLKSISLIEPLTAGSVFSNARLTNKDGFIKKCYDKNKSAFDNVTLDFAEISKLIDLANNNMWFEYLLASFNNDVGWIDFEKEIKKVLLDLKKIFSVNQAHKSLYLGNDAVLRHLLKYFHYFTNNESKHIYRFNEKYLIEDPVGSRNFKLDVDSITDVLFAELCNLGEMLKIYLSQFVEKTVSKLEENDLDEWVRRYAPQQIISFNYTNTYEQLFSNDDVIHIHGTNNNKIVLGVNPDDDDKIDSIDTSFLSFKKYYQRVFWGTDIDYLDSIKQLNSYTKGSNQIILTVIGHSLDETDKDVIVELFKYATDIHILYYDSVDLSKHVNNLINIYGKTDFDELRYKKGLKFSPLSEEIKDSTVLKKVFQRAVINAML